MSCGRVPWWHFPCSHPESESDLVKGRAVVGRRRGEVTPDFQDILVPLDFAPQSDAALRKIARIAQGTGTRVVLLHVIETIDHLSLKTLGAFYRRLEGTARTQLKMRSAWLRRAGLEVECEIVRGHRAAAIVRCAERRGVDLVVLGSHRVSRGSPVQAWSTVSHMVAIFATCPVLLLK
jgi:nucleotide-binding universal stress UspA family protein